MARIYRTKPDAKKEKLTVPMSVDLLIRLTEHALVVGRSRTEVARELIEKGLKRGNK